MLVLAETTESILGKYLREYLFDQEIITKLCDIPIGKAEVFPDSSSKFLQTISIITFVQTILESYYTMNRVMVP